MILMTREDREHLVKMLQADLAGECVEVLTHEGWAPISKGWPWNPIVSGKSYREHFRIKPVPRELFVNEYFGGEIVAFHTLRKALTYGNHIAISRRTRWVEDVDWKAAK